MKYPSRLSIGFATALTFGCLSSLAWARPSRTATPTPDNRALREPARASLKLELRLDPGARGLYVGQAVPVTIHAYFLGGTGVTITGQPRMTSDALLLSELTAEPRQSSVQVRGLPYTALTWTGTLTAIRAGESKTEIELPVALTYREAPRVPPMRAPGQGGQPDDGDDADGAGQQDGGGDPFASLLRQSPFASDPFFARMFNGHDPLSGMFEDLAGTVRRRDVTLRDSSGGMKVMELPTPRPPEFSGAVGTFDINAALSDETFRVGEPTSLELTVRGKGSFSRLAVPALSPTSDLNAYGVTSTFTPGPGPLAGEKVFKQTIAPRHAGALTIPAATLSYFDPRERRYVTRHTTPMRVEVAPPVGGKDLAAGVSDVREAVAPKIERRTAVAGVPEIVGATLTPSFRTRRFWMLVVAIALAGAALTLLGWTYRNGALGRVAAARRVDREIARQRRDLDAAASRGDAATLFGAGRKALQTRLGAVWGVPADAIATADIVSRLGAKGERIKRVFERADRLTYAGGPGVPSSPPRDLDNWQQLILDELRILEART
ncbi:MAG TPA: BatD family protein [Polyangia bacterium]|jgi:hypothetical protein